MVFFERMVFGKSPLVIVKITRGPLINISLMFLQFFISFEGFCAYCQNKVGAAPTIFDERAPNLFWQ